jgi:hypothetical protein
MLTAATLYFSAAASMAWISFAIWGPPDWSRPLQVAAAASAPAFLSACILVFFRPRWGYALGLVAGLLPLPSFVRIETSDTSWSSWVFFNSGMGVPLFAKLNILSLALIVISIACSLIRFLPAGWSWRGYPVSGRTWPAFTVGFLVLATWFARSAMPYQVPGSADGIAAELRILHLQKTGLRIHGIEISEFRDGQAFVARDDRQFFQYEFETRVARIALWETSPAALERARALVRSPELRRLRTPLPTMVRSWKAEGWYVVLKDSQAFAFTSENGRTPPREVTDLFDELERLPTSQEQRFAVRDVCLGFCYDPVAALGFSVLRQRTSLSAAPLLY